MIADAAGNTGWHTANSQASYKIAPGRYQYFHQSGSTLNFSVNWSGVITLEWNTFLGEPVTLSGSNIILGVQTYTLTINAMNGTVTKNPDQATYTHGTQVQLTATANTGYHFVNWSGDLSSAANPVTITMDVNKTITANFAQDQCIQPPSGLVSWWPGDGNANDIVGVNHGTLQNGATFVTGKVGQAFSFDGVDDFVRVPDKSDFNLSNFTLDAWIKTTSSTFMRIVSQQVRGQGDVNDFWLMGLDDAGKLRFGSSLDNILGTNGPVINDGLWHYVAVVRDIISNLGLWYVDGILVGTQPATSDVAFNLANDVMIGRFDAGGGNVGQFFNGSIDEVEVFNRALSASEIQSIFLAGSAGQCKPDASCPNVTTQPVDQTVCEGSNVSFGASASGIPSPTLQWQVSGDGGSTWSNTGSGTSPLIFTANASDNGKQYKAVFTNSCGSASSSVATLLVNTVPVIMTNPVTQTACEGSEVSFGVAATGAPTPTLQWQVSNDNGITWSDIAGATASPLTFTASASDIGKQYRAVFANSCGSATTDAATLSISTYTISASAGANGSISPLGTVSVNCDATQTFSIVANTGYHIADVLVDGSSVGAVSSYQFTGVQWNHTIAASFAINTYTLTVNATDGSITKNPDQTSYNHGTQVEVTATPNTGYHFVDWSGDASGTANPLTITMDATKNITANFAEGCIQSPSGIVSWWPMENNANDIVDGNDPSATNAISYIPGKVLLGVTFTVPPNSSTAGGYIDIPHSANLALQQFTIEAWVKPYGIGPNDDVIGSAIISKPSSPYYGVELAWRSDGKFRFLFGNMNYDVITSAGTFPPGSFYHVAATSDGTNFRLFVNGTQQGSMSRSNYTITYDASYKWAIGSEPAPFRNNRYPRTWNGIIDEVDIFNRALSPLEIQAIYAAGSAGKCKTPALYMITATAGEHGTISPSGYLIVNSAGSQTFTITPDQGYHLATLTDNSSDVLSQVVNNQYTVNNITADHTIEATFAINTYQVTASVTGGGGTIAPSSQTANYHENATVTITPSFGYHLAALTDNQQDVLSQVVNNQYTVTNVTANHTIEATFQPLFIEVALFPGLWKNSTAWGDYDKDGDLDILLAGTDMDTRISKIYQNNNGNFNQVTSVSLLGVYDGSVAWGDYDNDGDLDIFLTGDNSGNHDPISKIYQNIGGTFTEVTTTSIPGVTLSSVAWGDYDNDGDLDILLTGASYSGPISKIYQNDEGNFTEVTTVSLQGVMAGSVAWGDYDNDGDLDILLTGANGYSSSSPISKIYQNTGGNFAELSTVSLMGVSHSSCAWGDYDNDGDLDILLSGESSSGNVSKIYRNTSGSFSEDNSVSLPGFSFGSAAWGDYDNDGDLDILLAGWAGSSNIPNVYQNTDGNFTPVSTLFGLSPDASAAWGDYDNDGDLDIVAVKYPDSRIYQNTGTTFNSFPLAPSGLTATVSGSNVTLTWDRATDAQTPQNGLTYNLRIGATPDGINTESPMANVSNGYRRIVQLGNANQNTAWTIKNLLNGTYYWSVQAIDNAFAGSAFAPEATFTVNCQSPLVITCPANVTVSSITSPIPASSVTLGSPTVSHNCPGVSVSNNAPSSYAYGATQVTWTATDASGNTSTCNQTVTVTIPTTKLQDAYCGATISLPSSISCDPVQGATNYQWEFSHPQSGFLKTVQSGNSSEYYLSLSFGLQLGRTYAVRIKPYINGVWLDYGPVCQITIPLPKVRSADCGITLSSMTQSVYCNVQGLYKYQWEVTEPSLNYSSVFTTQGPVGYIFRFSFLAGIQYGTTYTVRVRAQQQLVGAWTAYGDPCSITTPIIPVITDSDGDGIDNNIDTQPGVFSNNYSDVGLGGTTTGTITTRGGRIWNVFEEPSPKGIHIIASNGSSLAKVVGTGICVPTVTNTISANVAADFVLTCGSVALDVIQGQVISTATEGDLTLTASIDAGNAITFSSPGDGTIVVAAEASASNVVLTANGETITLEPGQTIVSHQTPLVTCPADVTILATTTPVPASNVSLGTPTIGGNCPGAVASNNAPASYPFGTTNVMWTATDPNCYTSTCNQTVTVVPAATIRILSSLHRVGSSGSTKEALAVNWKVFDKAVIPSPTPKNFSSIWGSSTGLVSLASISVPVLVPHGNGMANLYTILVPSVGAVPGISGSYVIIGRATVNATNVYVGSPTDPLATGSLTQKYEQVILNKDGKITPATTTAITGSLLLITEPAYLEFTSNEEVFPLIVESIDGEWELIVDATPPNGFVNVTGALATSVSTGDLSALEFTIRDLGSKWTETDMVHTITHKGRVITYTSKPAMINKKRRHGIKIIPGIHNSAESFTPTEYALYQNFPEPFNPTTTIQFDVPEQSVVSLKVYNSLGQLVETLVDDVEFGAGRFTVPFNASELASGVYIYRMTAGTYVRTMKMLMMK